MNFKPENLLHIRQNRPLLLALAGVIIMLVAAFVCGSMLLLTLLPTSPPLSVMLVVSGTNQVVETNAETVGDLLDELGLTLNTGDALSLDVSTPLTADTVIRLDRARTVNVTIDDETETFDTLFTSPRDILSVMGIIPGEKDRVIVDGTEATAMDLLLWPVPATNITVQQAVTVNIDDQGVPISIMTTAPTVGEALFEAGVTLYLADNVMPDVNTPVTADMNVSIERSQPVSIVADGVTLETRSQGATVADGLASAGVALMGLDYSIPEETSPLQPGMSIRVIRVNEIVEAEQSAIAFETVLQADAEMELDQQIVIQEGQNGIQQTNIRVRYENGSEVSRTPESTTVAVEPINRVIAYGTKIVIRTLDTPDGPIEYWRVLRMYTTSYHPAALGGDNVTATGKILTKGIVGIDPKVIPYGSRLYVPGYGIGEAADTGGPRRFALWIDLGYDDSNWVSWSKYTDVYLMTPVPAEIDYILPE
ncbi:MAG: G5 domain-containing protein [Anaerolineae bacterium]|nr:G5 domain-containing protein [Anaerolineae bacterium]